MKVAARLFALTLATAPAMAASPLLNKFQELDKNHDGKLTRDELTDKEWFQRLDLNNDGEIPLAEAVQALLALRGGIPGLNGTAAAPAPAPVQEAPKILKAAEFGIGSLVPDLAVKEIGGREAHLSDFTKKSPALVVASVSPTCPVSKRYLPTIARLADDYAKREVALVLLTGDTVDDSFREALKAAGLDKRTCIQDASGELRRALGSTSSTDTFVLDSARTLQYRGAIDDQYGLGYSRDVAQRHYLSDAVDAVLASQPPRIAATEAPGCALDLTPAVSDAATPTYHAQVARIVQAHCLECHRAGGVAPFALETYEQVTAKAGMIRKMVDRGLMPPWFAAPVEKGAHSPWANDRSLAERERTQLLAWLANGKPEGNAADAPRPRVFAGDWQIGTPDLVLQIPQPIEVKATGTMPYQYAMVETNFDSDKWVRGFEVQPTAREVVHHVIVSIVRKDQPNRRDGGFLAAYVPGNNSVVYPEGFAKQIPAGAKLRFQIHYTPNGAATKDQVKLGLQFASAPPEHVVRIAEAINPRLNIPPHADNHLEKASIPVPANVLVLGFMPHMHVRGKAFRYEVDLPGGETKTLLDVPRYDFNWQLAYRYAEPLALPAGATIRASGWFDNSANNPANPDPEKNVRWGEQTTDEMMLGYVEYCLATPDHPRISKAE